MCFIRRNCKDIYYKLIFKNNTAVKAGAALYGGWINLCEPNNNVDINSHNFLEFKAENSVSSSPTRVCMCTNSTVNHYITEAHFEVFPGQTFEIDAVAVGQRFGVVPSTVRAETDSDIIDNLQKIQDTEMECTTLKYTVRSANKTETMILRIDK